jgi:hypothetical protein
MARDTVIFQTGAFTIPRIQEKHQNQVSPFCPAGQMYFFNSRFVSLSEGPMVTETWAEPGNSDTEHRGYVDVRIFNAFRAGFKARLHLPSPEVQLSLVQGLSNQQQTYWRKSVIWA